jgi:hypothetical protein
LSIRLLRKLIVFSFLIIVLAIVIFAVFIHPNDSRIDFALPSLLNANGSRKNFKKRASLSQKNIHLNLDVSKEKLNYYKEHSSKLWPTRISWDLERFKFDFQVFVTVGKYPQYLDGRDSVFIPPGGTLVMKMDELGEGLLEFGAAFGASGGNIILRDSKNSILDSIKSRDAGLLELLSSILSPWIFPTLLRAHPNWDDRRIEIKGEKDISFECIETEIGCFISNLNFFEETSAPLKQTILILVDTLRYDSINSKKSPSLYEFLEGSTHYENAVSPGNMTSPSTNALLACTPPTFLGSWAFSYGVQDFQRIEFEKRSEKSFPRVISDSGIQTVMLGNISVVSELIGVGQNHGFERQISMEFDGYDTPLITEEALRWISRNRDKDFLLYIHYNAPHAPHRPPWKDIFRVWSGAHIFASYVHILDTLYSAEISYIDRYFDKLINFLRNEKLYSDLNIILTSDHGDQMRPHRFAGNEWGPSFTGTYHDHGATLLNDEVRVPLIVKSKGQTDRKKVKNFVSTLQVGPTIIEQLTSQVPYRCYLPKLPITDEEDSQLTNILPIEGFRERAILFDGKYKYIRAYEPTVKRVHSGDGYMSQMRPYFVKERLFDLVSDPEEDNDIKSDHVQRLVDARNIYRKAFKIEVGFELVIELKDPAELKIELPDFARVKNLSENFIQSGQIILSKEPIKGRHSFVLSDLKGKYPVVYLNGIQIKLFYTRNKLPLEISSSEQLPFEDLGSEHLFPSNQLNIAYLRKIWDPNREELGIRVSNPEFEAMLREWGYLNDN